MSNHPPITDTLLLLALGLAGLWVGTQLVVGNAVGLAQRFQVSELFIGLTLLALGTDLPELLVAVDGALHNLRGIPSSGVVVGTAVGSSVSQISLVLGITALLHYVTVGRRQLRLLGLELVASCVLLFGLAWDGHLSRADGVVLVAVFALYMAHTVWNRAAEVEAEAERVLERQPPERQRPAWMHLALVALGLAVVVASSELTVNKALDLSAGWGLQQSFVGAILVGVGTSTPELAVSLRAMAQKRTGLSVGNVVGSNIFDLLIPTGVAATMSTLEVERTVVQFDLPYLLVTTLVVVYLLRRKRGLQRWEGGVLVGLFVVYGITRYLLNPA